MHRIRQLILAGTQPPDCFEPASKTISDEMATASALMLSYRVADWRGFLRFQRDLATRLPPWGEEHASAMHSIRAWGDLKVHP